MTTAIVRTKLCVPRVRAQLVSRPRLLAKLGEGLSCELTLISAPAGFGKTTLLSEWAANAERPVAWLSLGEDDNEPSRFWIHFVAALQTVHADVGEGSAAMFQLAQRAQSSPVVTLLTPLINEIAELPHAFALVLDDYHVITDGQVNDALAFLVDNMPPQMHLVIASRADPPLPLSRLRGRGQMHELRADALRFTPAEAAAFLNDVMGLDLSADEVAALVTRTEGWVVGLQMAGLSLQGRGRAHVADFIASFAGSHRYVLTYLTDEVLDRQPDNVRAFLLETAILGRLCASLCNAVTGQSDGQAMLRQLEEANLFVIPLDDEQSWYRYHHLFADLLGKHLQQTQPDRVADLHRRASDWFEKNGLIGEAVSHALQANDVDRVSHLAGENVLAVMDLGVLPLATFTSWLEALPEETVRTRPWLRVSHAWALLYANRHRSVEPVLRDLERSLNAPAIRREVLSEAEHRHILGHVATIRSYLLAVSQEDEGSQVTRLAREALDLLPADDLTARTWVTTILVTMLRRSGDLEGALRVSKDLLAASRAAGDEHAAVTLLAQRVHLQIAQGRLRETVATCREVFRLAGEYVARGGYRLAVSGYAHAALADVLCEWNQLEEALHHATESARLSEPWGIAGAVLTSSLCLARVLWAVGDIDGALDEAQKASQPFASLSARDARFGQAIEARIRVAQGDVEAASRWVREAGLRVDGDVLAYGAKTCFALARVLIAQGRWDDALELLARVTEIAEAGGANGELIQSLVLQALALQAQGEVDRALADLERALALAEPEGYVRTFIAEGAPMALLLRRAAAQGISVEYVGRLLAALEAEPKGGARPSGAPVSGLVHGPSVGLIEPLSAREMEVLRLLAHRLTNKEIAATLVISVTTVKKHLQNIYGKLGAHGRREAVERASKLGLLENGQPRHGFPQASGAG